MKRFIRELYYGNIDPQAKTFDRDSDYGKALGMLADHEQRLVELLTGEVKTLFSQYMDKWGEVLGMTAAESFTEGFRMGANFMLDAFLNGDGIFKDIQ